MNTPSKIHGYLSEEQKSKFTITAGIIGASFLILHFILPFVFMLFMFPSMMFMQNDMFKRQELNKSTVLNNQLWYTSDSFGPGNQSSKPLMQKVSITDKQEPEKVCGLSIDSPWLLADKNTLWLISSSAVGYIKNNQVELIPDTRTLGEIYRPFLYQGLPAVIENSPEGFNLVVFKDRQWLPGKKLSLEGSNEASKLREIQIVVLEDNEINIFAMFDSIIYFRKGLPFADKNPTDRWEPVTPSGYHWCAVNLNGKPAVFYTEKQQGINSTIYGARSADGKWGKFFNYQSPVMDQFSVHPLQSEKFLIALNSFPGSFYIINAANNTVSGKFRHGNNFPFPPGMMAMMFIPHIFSFILPLMLALVLSSLMLKYRVCYYTSDDDRQVPFASLTRRALSQIIDAVFAGFPIIIGMIIMFQSIFDFEKMLTSDTPYFMLSGMLFMLAGLGWGLICLFLFSWWEGTCGQTPGKWFLGIKVLGTDLQPCGFGRAIVRNLLKFVDGFLQFMVGIMLIALTENWQRIGDMAARTIVVMKEKKDVQI